MKIVKLFCSVYVTVALLALYGILCAVATFIEADAAYGTSAAQDLIYRTAFFNIVHFLLLLNLIGVFVIRKFWKTKKYYSMILHISFIVILIGAAITRFYGFEGLMHIREGSSVDSISTLDEYINIGAVVDGEFYSYKFPVRFNSVTQTRFNEVIPFHGKNLVVKFNGYQKGDMNTFDVINITVSYDGETSRLTLPQSYLDAQIGDAVRLGGIDFQFIWGPAQLSVPFKINLDDFILTRYPGSESPSSYKSKITVTNYEDNSNFSYEIFMNNVLDYKGYRFFQSSYDTDEKGTILSVNKDPGKIPTYIGYFLLTVGFLWSFFGKHSRIWQLSNYLKKQNLYALLIGISSVFFMLAGNAYAQENIGNQNGYQGNVFVYHEERTPEEIEALNKKEIDALSSNISKNMKDHSKKLAKILVQDYQGRIKPLDTLALDILHKLIRKESYNGMNHVEIFLGMMLYRDTFEKMKMFPIKTKELKKLLGIEPDEEYVAFKDVFNAEGKYKLSEAVSNANKVSPYNRNKFEKELIKFNEQMNIAYTVYNAQMFLIIPDITGKTTGFLTPDEAVHTFDAQNSNEIKNILQNYLNGVRDGIANNNWAEADKNLDLLVQYQKTHGAKILPSDTKVSVEIFMNSFNNSCNVII